VYFIHILWKLDLNKFFHETEQRFVGSLKSYEQIETTVAIDVQMFVKKCSLKASNIWKANFCTLHTTPNSNSKHSENTFTSTKQFQH